MVQFKQMENKMNSKEEIIKQIESVLDKVEESSAKDMIRPSGWYKIFEDTCKRFISDIESTILFKKLEAGWMYELEYDYSAFKLLVVHQSSKVDGHGEIEAIKDQLFTLVSTAAPYLSTAEYAAIYGIDETTARTQLRRGKLRAAERVGGIWRIPALLTPPRVRGYQTACYSWDTELADLNSEFEYINKYKSLLIEQDDDKTKYNVKLFKENSVKADKTVTMEPGERERLELMLISNPDIHYNARADEGVLSGILI